MLHILGSDNGMAPHKRIILTSNDSSILLKVSHFYLLGPICWKIQKFSSRNSIHDDVIKWKHFPRNWPFMRGIHRSPVNSPHKGQWRGALMFTLIWARINGWINTREAGDLSRNRGHYDVIVMSYQQNADRFVSGFNVLDVGQHEL